MSVIIVLFLIARLCYL